MQLKQSVRTLWHAVLRKVVSAEAPPDLLAPKRILLINGAHIGDVVIATSLLPVLKSAFSQAEIGFLTGSWSHAVVRHHPDVSYHHVADHWRMNRGAGGSLEKKLRYWQTRRQALQEIRALSYDLSVSMHPWRADFLPLAWQAAIPLRVAFRQGLWAPLATALADYPEPHRFIHQGECQLRLLRELGIGEEHLRLQRASLAPSTPEAVREVCQVLGFSRVDEAPYSVIHMGAGCAAKEVSYEFWKDVAARLSGGQRVLFTGKGAREGAAVQAVTAGLPNCVDACGKLSWDGFVAAIRYARTLYGVDSMAAHVAAALGTKCIALYGGMNNIARFRPYSDNATVWTNAVPCAACQRQLGCKAMTCMRGFDPEQVLQIAQARAT